MGPQFRRAIVVGTGGIGTALAAALADQGASVHGFSRSGASVDERVTSAAIDIEDEASIARAATDLRQSGEFDLILVTSGLLQDDMTAPEKSFRHLSAENFRRYFAINAAGPALIAKHFLPLLGGNGPAVFAALSARVGSISDNRLGGWYGYRASKAALNMIIKTMAIELARTRPHALCVALHPGTVDTPLSKPFQRGVPAGKLFAPAQSASHLLRVISSLRPPDSGGCFAWDGARIEP